MHYSFITKSFAYFNDCFEAVFLSYRLKQRKPEPLIFSTIIESTSLPPASILFIDDIPENIGAAKKAGLNTLLYTTTDALVKCLKSVGLQGLP